MSGLAILCSGQGEQRPDMLDRYAGDPRADALLAHCRPSLPQAARDWLERPDAAGLFTDAVAQPLLCLAQMLAMAVLGEDLPEPSLFAGYSLGELASYGAAGVFAPETLLGLAGKRAACMDAAATVPSGLSAVLGLPEKAVAGLCAAHGGHVAIVDGPEHVIVGAALADLPGLEQGLAQAGATRLVRLRVPLASHTPLLAGASRCFGAVLDTLAFRLPGAAILSGVTASPVWNPAEAKKALADQLERTVRFGDAIEAAVARGCGVFLELGPGASLSHMVLERHPEAQARSLDDFKDPRRAVDWLRRVMV
ncbi:MAG: acyltransferase domain-containing protein [Solidesulfovibrio sp. DCME]|uniref:acyltransferase domain-containing protein n=1 Tax=Solidesulfovibrio sp. DCME TaxID=3447380 RepID=UPI003D116D37